VERFLLGECTPLICGGGDWPMKIYFLLMIVSVFVAFSYIPIRLESKKDAPAPADSVPA
jgi:hypothetical protein